MSSPRPLRCSAVARAAGEDPAGTAPRAEHFLLVEVPLPWPAQALRAAGAPEGVADACARAKANGRSLKALAIAPAPELAQAGMTRVIHLHRPSGPFAEHAREEFLVPRQVAAELVEALLSEGGDRGPFAEFAVPGGSRDLLVCTHGAEDTCCGQLGAQLFDVIRRDHGDVPGLRAWRSSHLGGHRFAPTIFDLPSGESWAYVDEEALRQIVRREGSVAPLRDRVRGWAGFDYFEQLVGREAFLYEGWAWTACPKSASTRVLAPGDVDDEALLRPLFTESPAELVQVRVAFEPHDGRAGGVYEGIVQCTGQAEGQGACGEASWLRNTYQVSELARQPAADPSAEAHARAS